MLGPRSRGTYEMRLAAMLLSVPVAEYASMAEARARRGSP